MNENIQWQSVDSSNIEAVAYDAEEKQIFVRFKDGAEWVYDNCEQKLFDSFLNAPSIGKFFHANIKTHSAERLN